jgi:D-alanyl-D-alanine carboxypeptidase/D-alanyl-D-alanine-endopeptidase (penicillin-binding protein 4)
VDHTYADFTVANGWTAPDPLAGLRNLAGQIAARGIRRITGDIVIDERMFDPAESTGSGPSRLSPIVVNDNVVDFLITPTQAGSPAVIAWRPQTPLITVDAQIETAAADSDAAVRLVSPEPGRVVLRGRIPAGGKPLLRIYAVNDPASFARSLFMAELARAGIAMVASPLDRNRGEQLPAESAMPAEKCVASLESPPFREEARLILKVSHNLHASTLPLLVAANHGRRTLADGLKLQHDFLVRAGVDVDTISLGGAAGGARSDFVTPRATVQLLRYMSTRPDFPAYEQALPILGVDGTLATISTNSPARGKLRAKTGTLLWENTMNGGFLLTSKALAGYLTTSHQRELVLAFFVNQVHLKQSSDSASVGATLGRLCEILYEEL